MKKLLYLFGVLLATSPNIFAQSNFTKNDAIDEICKNTSEYSQSVMRSRQLGENIVNNIRVVNETLAMAESVKQYHKNIIYEAYKEPIWSSDENKRSSIAEFGNKMYLVCVESFYKELSNID